jgi:hypothetical protein
MEKLRRNRVFIAHSAFFIVSLICYAAAINIALNWGAFRLVSRVLIEGSPFIAAIVAVLFAQLYTKEILNQVERRGLIYGFIAQTLLIKIAFLAYPYVLGVFKGLDIKTLGEHLLNGLQENPSLTVFVISNITVLVSLFSFLGVVIAAKLGQIILKADIDEAFWHNTTKYVAIFTLFIMASKVALYFLPVNSSTSNGMLILCVCVLFAVQMYQKKFPEYSTEDWAIMRRHVFIISVVIDLAILSVIILLFAGVQDAASLGENGQIISSMFIGDFAFVLIPLTIVLNYIAIKFAFYMQNKKPVKEVAEFRDSLADSSIAD